MDKIIFYQLLYLQILSFVNSFLYYTLTKSYFILLYNVPFLSIITVLLIKFNASFLDINAKLILYALPLLYPIAKLCILLVFKDIS